MIEIYSDEILDSSIVDCLHDSIEWLLTKLGISLGISLEISINSELDCCGYLVTNFPNGWTIELRNDSDMLLTLCHECVHLDQFTSGQFSHTSNLMVCEGEIYEPKIWQGELFTPKTKGEIYWDSPWEIEAREREKVLHKELLEYLRTLRYVL